MAMYCILKLDMNLIGGCIGISIPLWKSAGTPRRDRVETYLQLHIFNVLLVFKVNWLGLYRS